MSKAECTNRFESVDEIRHYVAETLSRFESLEAANFELSQQILHRNGKPCGVHFCLHGPRALRLSAIWETDQNSILFYGSCGRRMHRIKLAQSPQIL